MDEIPQARPRVTVVNLVAAVAVMLSLCAVFYLSRGWIRAAEVVDREFARNMPGHAPPSGPAAVYMENDSYYWLGYAKDVMAGGDWREHATKRDNPPEGRPVHWAFPYIGLLLVAGKLTAIITGLPPGEALEVGACWINPALWAGLILLGATVTWRWFGAVAAAVLVLLLVAIGDLGWAFQALRPDHQGLHVVGAFAMVLLLAASGLGWVESADLPGSSASLRAPRPEQARWYFALAGIAGGLGMWVSAAVQSFVILGVFLTIVLLVCFSPQAAGKGRAYHAGFWRIWGWCGAGVSLLAYALEYFPHGLGWHLEVNHPVYALVWVAMAEVLFVLTEWRFSGGALSGAKVAYLVIGGLIVVALPALIFFGPPGIHAMRDGYMARLHHFIGEFYSYPAHVKGPVIGTYLKAYGPVALSLGLTLYLADARRSTLLEWSVLWLVFALTFFFLIISYLQIRWLGVYAAMQALLAAIAIGLTVMRWNVPEWRARAWVGAGLAVVLAAWSAVLVVGQAQELNLIIAKRNLPDELSGPAMRKQVAVQIRDLRGDRPWRFLSDPDFAPALQYFAGVPCVMSFYWENGAGLHAGVDFLTDEKGEVARQIAVSHGLTHVLTVQGNRSSNYLYFIRHGVFSMEQSERTLAGAMNTRRRDLPDWLRLDPELEPLGNQVFRYTTTPLTQPLHFFVIRN